MSNAEEITVDYAEYFQLHAERDRLREALATAERERDEARASRAEAIADVTVTAIEGVGGVLRRRIDALTAQLTKAREALEAARETLAAINVHPSVGIGVATVAANAMLAIDALALATPLPSEQARGAR